uniref:Oxidoreductase NAD-binding domain containing 1 n=1 Tax=Fundulus heteroclitus TaxID=8078 RepID=A0A3Q2PI26_FUNHE
MSAPCWFIRSAARSLSRQSPATAPLCWRLLLGPGSANSRRSMSSKRQMDHLERTASNYRQNALYPAQVCGIVDESETVKRLRLAVHPDFSFKAGQWVDFFIPGVEKVGGFSMCSSPGLLQREGVVELAVKYTTHPPAHWIHTVCAVGSRVAMRVGGNFYFDPLPSDPSADLLLVAGGVGINPLYSILLHTSDLLRLSRSSGGRDYRVGSAHLCYSAKNTQELLFKVRLFFPPRYQPRIVGRSPLCHDLSCVYSRAPSLRNAPSFLTSSPATFTSRSRGQRSSRAFSRSSKVIRTHTNPPSQLHIGAATALFLIDAFYCLLRWENHGGGVAGQGGPTEDFVLPVRTPADDRGDF